MTDACVCGHELGDHVLACPKCGEDVRGLDVACARCGAFFGDEIERAAIEPKNGLAIAAFAISLLVPVAGIIAVILGLIAMRQIKRRPMQRGQGFAIAAVSLGCFWTLAIGIGLVVDGF